MKKRYLFLMLCLFYAGITKADTEPSNNAPGTTTDVLTLGGSQAGQVGPGDNDDYYQVTTSADGNITISLSNNNNAYTYIYLYNANGTSQLGTSAGNALSGITFTANGLSAGTYYVRVLSTATTNYTLSGTLASPPQANDSEPNNTPATALSYTVNTSVSQQLYNSLESPALQKYPILQVYQEYFREQGALGTLMSGSGSTTFAIFKSIELAQSAESVFRSRFSSVWTTSLAL